MQKMFVVMPPQKKTEAVVVKDAELHEIEPLKTAEDGTAAANA
jgi:hypothetical protein